MAEYPGQQPLEAVDAKEATVATPSLAYTEMLPHWGLPHTLMGGTEAMQAAAENFLPKEELETQQEYMRRLVRSTLFPAFPQTVQDLSRKPFQKDIKAEQLPAELKPMLQKCDATRRSLTVFATDAMRQGILDGLAFIFVDYPRLTDEVKTLKDQRDKGMAPYFCLIPAQDVIEVKFHQVGDDIVLDRVRIRETTKEQVLSDEPGAESWGEVEVCRIRVWYPDRWDLYEESEENGKKEWAIVDTGVNSLGEIPLTPFYTKQTGAYTALPPLEELAFLNLKHWRVQSDHDNVLHISAVPVLFGRGIDMESDTIAIGASKGVMSNNIQAELKWVEFAGTAIKATQEHLDKLERQMSVLGFEPLILLPVSPTATEVMANEAEAMSAIQAWIGALETALEQAFRFAAKWMGLEITDEQAHVDIYREFGFSRNEITQLDILFKTWQLDGITLESWLLELKRRGLLRDDFNVKAEMSKLETAGTALGGDPANPDLGNVQDPTARPKKTLTPVGAANL